MLPRWVVFFFVAMLVFYSVHLKTIITANQQQVDLLADIKKLVSNHLEYANPPVEPVVVKQRSPSYQNGPAGIGSVE